MRFESPWYLLILTILPMVYFIYRYWVKKQGATLKYSSIETVRGHNDWKIWLTERLFTIRLILFALLIFALARPQAGQSYEEYMTEGIDIILAIDASGSMRAEDFAPKSRLEVAKDKVREFIKGRRGDRIGIIAFGEASVTLCPLTIDYSFLLKRLEELELGIIPEEKTAIGMGLANGLNRLKNSSSKNKLVILLTDGMNNAGKIDPLTAAELAKAIHVKVYTIGIGKEGIVKMPVNDPIMGKRYVQMKTEIDESTLTDIANRTGGQYFRATSEEALKNIYKVIDEMEKTRVDVKVYTNYKELFHYFLWPSVILLFLERFLYRTWLRVLP